MCTRRRWMLPSLLKGSGATDILHNQGLAPVTKGWPANPVPLQFPVSCRCSSLLCDMQWLPALVDGVAATITFLLAQTARGAGMWHQWTAPLGQAHDCLDICKILGLLCTIHPFT